MSKFIAAMDHSGGSTGGVLDRYKEEYTEDNKMEKVHKMRLRMVNSPFFISKYIRSAILYKDTVDRGMVPVLSKKGIESILKIDSGCNDDGTLKEFPVDDMCLFAKDSGCKGTKMRSIVKTNEVMDAILEQQFNLAENICSHGLIPIVEPEIPIDHPEKADLENTLRKKLGEYLKNFTGDVIFKLTLPEQPNQYKDLLLYNNLKRLVGLSGGYRTEEACRRLSQNDNMSASFSRALSEGLYVYQTNSLFNARITKNIKDIVKASS